MNDLDRRSWLLALSGAIADIVTTWVGIEQYGLVESNEIVQRVLTEFGYPGLFGMKIVACLSAVGLLVGVNRMVEERIEHWAVALPLALVWWLAALINVAVMMHT
jgi:uncharacterized membrane protein